MATKKNKNKGKQQGSSSNLAVQSKNDDILGRGKIFQGTITKKFPKRVVIEFERTVFIQKYNAFYMKKTRLHARLPDKLENQIQVGDYIEVQECRPLSKLIHFIVIKKIRSAVENIGGNKQ